MTEFDSVVSEMMREFGFTAKLLSVTVGEYDTAQSEAVKTVVEIPVRAILLDYPLRRDGSGSQAGSLIKETDKLLYVQPSNKSGGVAMPSINPSSDSIKIGNDVYNIVVAKDLNPTTTDSTLLELYIRK